MTGSQHTPSTLLAALSARPAPRGPHGGPVTYYLQPSGQVAAKPYKLLVQALGCFSKAAVAKYAWSGRERLGLLRVRGEVLVLHSMRWPDEIRSPDELLPPPVQLSDEEIEGALALMDTMTVEDLERLDVHDQYTEAMAQIIEAKREDRPLPAAPEPEQPAQVLDLTAALNASVEKARESRGEPAGDAAVTGMTIITDCNRSGHQVTADEGQAAGRRGAASPSPSPSRTSATGAWVGLFKDVARGQVVCACAQVAGSGSGSVEAGTASWRRLSMSRRTYP